MRKMIKLCTAALMSIAMVISMTGCGQGKEEKTQETNNLGTNAVTLNIAMDQGSSNGLTELSEAFMKKYPNVTINIYYQGWENLADKVAVSDKADPIDGFMIGFREELWTSEFLKVWQEKCEDFTDTDIVDLSEFNKGALDTNTVDGSIYGLPLCTSTFGMYTNEKILDECGITENPKTIDELLADCELIKQKGYTPMSCAPISLSYFTVAIAQYEVNASGKTDEFIDTALNSEDAAIGEYYRSATDVIATMLEKGYLTIGGKVYNPESNDGEGETKKIEDYSDECYSFLEGNTAFYPTYTDLTSSLEKREIKSDAYLKDSFDYNVIPVPTSYGQSALQTASYSLYVCKDSPNYDWMNEFVRFTFDGVTDNQIGNVSYFSDGQYAMSPFDNAARATDISKKYYSPFIELFENEETCLADEKEILGYHGYGISNGMMYNVFNGVFDSTMNSDQIVNRINEEACDWFVNGTGIKK